MGCIGDETQIKDCPKFDPENEYVRTHCTKKAGLKCVRRTGCKFKKKRTQFYF